MYRVWIFLCLIIILFTLSTIYSLKKCLLVPGTVLGTGDIVKNKAKECHSHGAYILEEKDKQ